MLSMLRKRMQDDKGFTLIELMVVVLIIAILIAIAIPTFLGLRSRSQDRAAQSDLRNGLTAAKSFYTDSDTYAGFDATEGGDIEPSLTWKDGLATVEGQVGVLAVDQVVTLSTESASGTDFCVRDDSSATGGGTTYGKTDGTGGCSGGW